MIDTSSVRLWAPMFFGFLGWGCVPGCSQAGAEVHGHAVERTAATPVPKKNSASAGAGGEDGAGGRHHVIVVVGDGMQMAHEVAASRYLFGSDDGLSFHAFPRRFFKTTWDVTVYDARARALGRPPYSPDSFDPLVGYDPALGGEAPYPLLPDTPERRAYFLNGPAPDSAATATAMSTGVKTDSNNIAWLPGDPPNGAIEASPATLKKLYGMSTGLVTTVPISHATPGSFFAHNVSRTNYYAIGKEILLETRPDVIIGGGLAGGSFLDVNDFETALATGKWVYVKREPQVDGGASLLAGAERAIREDKGLMAFFGSASGNFESPIPSDAPGAPSIARGNVENPRLADAAVAALEVLSKNPAGFFLLIEQGDIDWANHSNDFARMIGCVWDLHEAVASIVAFVDRPDDDVDWTNTTVIVTADHANSYLRLEKPLGQGDLPAQLGPGAYPDGEISYGSGGHTSELVNLYVRGEGADSFAELATAYPGLPIVDDTSIHRVTLETAKR